VGDTAVGRYLSVDVTTLALVQVDLRLEDVDFFSLHFQLLLEVFLKVLHLLLFCVIVVNENGLVGAVKLAVKFELMLTLLSDHVEQIGVLLDVLGELTLNLLELSFLLLDVADALLLGLLVFHLLVKDGLGWATDLKGVKIDKVTETEHLSLVVLTLLFVLDLVVLVNFTTLLGLLVLSFLCLLTKVGDLDVELTLTVDQLEQLGTSDQD